MRGAERRKGDQRRPRVSVVIPAYNHERYVGRAIESVLGQSFSDLELIVIDDGSTDSTLHEIEKYDDSRIRIFTQKNKGAARTINRGISLSRGEFVTILNSDDVYHPERLKRLVSLMDENPGCSLASTLIQPIDQDGRPVDKGGEHWFWHQWYERALAWYAKNEDPFFALLGHNFVVSTSNIFVRSEVFEKQKAFNELLAYCHDYEFLLRTVKEHGFFLINEELLYYRLHPLNTIRENVFMKHLEVLYTIFSEADIREVLSKARLDDKVSSPLFSCLVENPEVNPERYAAEYLAIIEEKDRAMAGLSRSVRALNKELAEKQSQLQEARQIEQRLGAELENVKAIVQEIYNSRGWKWLTRYGKMKQKTIGLLRSFVMGGQKRLRIYRSLKEKLKSPTPCAVTDRDVPAEATTQHIKILRPIEMDRPVVIHAIANFMTGGSSRLVADLVEHIGHRYEQEVITFFAPSPPAYTGFPIHEFPKSREKIEAFLNEKGVDLLHVHYWGDCDEPWYRKVFKAARKLGCPVIENVNTPVETYIDDVVDYYVYVSRYARGFSSVRPDPAKVIYPGSNLEMFGRNGAPVPDDVIGMVYRLENDKLREDSIQVFVEVIKRRPQTRAIIVGGGTFLGSYKRQVQEAGLADCFEFTGYVPYTSLPDYYRRFSVFVAPVWKESFGQVTPFAMGMEIPVAGYRIGALPEILGGDTYLGTNMDELADIIIDLLNNREERLRIGMKNRERALRYFSLEAMVRQYELIYEELLGRRGS